MTGRGFVRKKPYKKYFCLLCKTVHYPGIHTKKGFRKKDRKPIPKGKSFWDKW